MAIHFTIRISPNIHHEAELVLKISKKENTFKEFANRYFEEIETWDWIFRKKIFKTNAKLKAWHGKYPRLFNGSARNWRFYASDWIFGVEEILIFTLTYQWSLISKKEIPSLMLSDFGTISSKRFSIFHLKKRRFNLYRPPAGVGPVGCRKDRLEGFIGTQKMLDFFEVK